MGICMCVTKVCKQDISRTHWIHTIYGTKVVHGPYMCLIVFGDDVMHINEWAGLNAKMVILQQPYVRFVSYLAKLCCKLVSTCSCLV